MELAVERRKFTCVEYPGLVRDSDKMLESLGGESTINKIFNNTGQRLELHFRPKDFYSKTACANKHSTTCLVLKVRRKRRGGGAAEKGAASSDEYEGRILGTVESSYRFLSLADFQYLPMHRQTTTGTDNQYESIVPKISLTKREKSTWIDKPQPLFIPPTLFCRIENPTDYNYRDGPYKSTKFDSKTDDQNIISVHRRPRPHYTRIVMNENWTVPTEPLPQAVAKVTKKHPHADELAALRKVFEERPVWSRMALMMTLKWSHEFIKWLLPCVAYYVLTGPWRRVWVRFGYDPKQDRNAKVYQVLDFRVKDRTLSQRLGISIKRSTTKYMLPNKMTKNFVTTPRIEKEKLVQRPEGDGAEVNTQKYKDAFYKFYPGLIPAYHQICYQYCDLEEEQIQRLIHANDGQDTPFTDKDGWCLPETTEKIRKVILDYLKKAYQEDPVACRAAIGRQGEVNPSRVAHLPTTPQPEVAMETPAEEEEEEEEMEAELNSEEEDMFGEEMESEEDGEEAGS